LHHVSWITLLVSLVLFLALSLKNITLPGLYYDEALDVVPAMQLVQGAPVEAVRGAGLTIAGRTFPLMVMDYVGTVNTYLALPVFAVFGVSVQTVRSLPIALAVFSLILGFRLARRLFDWRVAAIATLLVAVDPSYVFFSRMGIHVTSVMNVFALGSLLVFLRWRESSKVRWLFVGGLLLGLGLWAKVLFLWWILALAVVWAVHGTGHGWHGTGNGAARRVGIVPAVRAAAGRNARPTVTAIAALLIGSAPLWVYNLWTGGTFISFGRNALVTEHGVSNLNVVGNLWAAVQSFGVLLDGRYFWFLGGQFANRLNIVAFVAACVVCVLLVRRRPAWRGGFGLVGALIALIVAQSAFTVSGIWATHLYILFPLPQIVVALGLILAAEALVGRGRRVAEVVVIVVAAGSLMAANLWVDARYHAALEQSRGLSRFSDAIYKLAGWLDERRFDVVYAVDWGIQKNVQILTQGRVNPIEISGYAGEPADAFVLRAEDALRRPGAVYLMHSKEDTVYDLFGTFQATAERLGYRLKIIDATRDGSGAPVHVMWVCE
jgi:hypothetical protein